MGLIMTVKRLKTMKWFYRKRLANQDQKNHRPSETTNGKSANRSPRRRRRGAMDMHGRAAHASREGIFAAAALIILQSSMQQLGWKRRRCSLRLRVVRCNLYKKVIQSESVCKHNVQYHVLTCCRMTFHAARQPRLLLFAGCWGVNCLHRKLYAD